MSLKNIVKVANYYNVKYGFDKLAQAADPLFTMVSQLLPIADQVVASMQVQPDGWKFAPDFDSIKSIYTPLGQFISANAKHPQVQNLNNIYRGLLGAHQLYWKKFKTKDERQQTLQQVMGLVNSNVGQLKTLSEGNVGQNYNTQGNLQQAMQGQSEAKPTPEMITAANALLPTLNQLANNIEGYRKVQTKEDMVKTLNGVKSALAPLSMQADGNAKQLQSKFVHVAQYLKQTLQFINDGLQKNAAEISTMWLDQVTNPLNNAITILNNISAASAA